MNPTRPTQPVAIPGKYVKYKTATIKMYQPILLFFGGVGRRESLRVFKTATEAVDYSNRWSNRVNRKCAEVE